MALTHYSIEGYGDCERYHRYVESKLQPEPAPEIRTDAWEAVILSERSPHSRIGDLRD